MRESKIEGVSIGSLIWVILIGFIIVSGIFFAAYLVYVDYARYIFPPIGGEKGAALGQLGDYFGGILNPIIGSFTLMLLGVTVFYQYKTMESTKQQLNLATVEHKINILQETARELHKEITLNVHQGIFSCDTEEISRLIEGFNIPKLPTDNGCYCIAHLSKIFAVSEYKEVNKQILADAISGMQPHVKIQYDQVHKNLKAFQSICGELLSLLDDTKSVKLYWLMNLEEIEGLLLQFPFASEDVFLLGKFKRAL